MITHDPSSRLIRSLPIVATAHAGFRMYWGTAALLAATSALALIAFYPVLPLAVGGSGPGLGFSTVRGSHLGLTWSAMPLSPAATQAEAVGALSRLLTGAAVGVLASLALTLTTLAGARAAIREGEIAVRRAVGASRRTLLLAGLLEGFGVAVAAILAGSGIGLIVARIAGATWPGVIVRASIATGLWAWGALLLLLLVSGLLAAMVVRRSRLVDAEPRPLALYVPAITQIGLSLVLLGLAGLFSRHVAGLSRPDPHPAGGWVFRLEAPATPPAQRAAAYDTLLARLSGTEQLSAVSLSSPGAIVGLGPVVRVTTDCGQCSDGGLQVPWRTPRAVHHFVSADSFRTLRIQVLAGRGLTPDDSWGAPRVAVVNQTLAARHFQFGEALGRQVKVGVGGDEWYTVVGVVRDRPAAGFGASRQPPYSIYLSILQHPVGSTDLLIRGLPGPAASAITNDLTRAAFGEDAGDPHAATESAVVRAEQAPIVWFDRLFTLESWVMTVIAGIGVFAFIRLWVMSLIPDLGLRRAVGARRRQIVGHVLARAALVGLAGVALGLWFGPSVWDALGGLLPGLPAWRAVFLAGPALLLASMAVLAAVLPARRASREAPARLLAGPGE